MAAKVKGKGAERFQGSAAIVRKSDEDPLTAFMTRAAFAALTCGFDLVSERGFSCSYAADAETPEEVEASRSVTWIWDDKKRATFKPIKDETIGFQEFERRFMSDTWYLENPDHPISYMRMFFEKSRKYLAIIRDSPPALRHVRGSAVVQALATATEEEIDELFAAIDAD